MFHWQMKTLQVASEWTRIDDVVLHQNILVSKFRNKNTCKGVFENMIRRLDVCQEIGGGDISNITCNTWFTFSSRQRKTRRERECVGYIRLIFHTRPILISSRSSRRHASKSVPSQRKWECLECLASLSMILARECECLHLCILCFVHISSKVSTSTREENVNQA